METVAATLSSPVILFFILGLAAAFARSDLSIPEALAKGLSIYLMIAIGLKGGIEVSKSGFTPDLLLAAAAGIALSFALPFMAYQLLTRFARLDRVNAAAVSAHYGSVSVVTYVTAVEILGRQGLGPAGYMVAVLALMETPAIISGLLLARGGGNGANTANGGGLWHEVLLNASVVLLIGSFLIGLLAGADGAAPIMPVFEGLFRGLLCLFLLDMGLVAGRRLIETRSLTARAAAMAILLPLLNGTLGTLIGAAIGLDAGSTAALGILAASASYIAVPAAMRLALPQADPGLYLSMSLGVTFPFNIIAGIPLYALLAQALT
ncbi:MAG TPA: sodium-dependent bicarbonate transport family permease [Allosphingosinicella sp.]|nr:sodium-dependent bicarbonate transport family permease [Allosphingosinicella sp.]